MKRALPDNGFFIAVWQYLLLYKVKQQELYNHIVRFSIPVPNLTGTVKCIEVVYDA